MAVSVLKNKFKKYFDILVVLAMITGGYFIFRSFDFQTIAVIKDRLNVWYLAGVFGGIFIIMLLRVYRWLLLLKPIKKNLSFLSAVEILVSSQVVNYASPGKLGVPARALLLKEKESVAIAHSTPSLLSELFLDNFIMLLMLIVTAFAGGYITFIYDLVKRYLVGYLLAAGIFLLVFAVLVTILFFVIKNKKRKIPFIENLLVAVRVSFRDLKCFTAAAVLSVAILFFSYFCDWLIFRALGLDVPYSFIIMAIAFSTIAGFLSPLPGGVGVREISNAYIFRLFYNMGEFALIVTILRRGLDYLMSIILYAGAKALNHRKKNMACCNAASSSLEK